MPDDFRISRDKLDELCVQLLGAGQMTGLVKFNALLE